jgi:hypothetical protein
MSDFYPTKLTQKNFKIKFGFLFFRFWKENFNFRKIQQRILVFVCCLLLNKFHDDQKSISQSNPNKYYSFDIG